MLSLENQHSGGNHNERYDPKGTSTSRRRFLPGYFNHQRGRPGAGAPRAGLPGERGHSDYQSLLDPRGISPSAHTRVGSPGHRGYTLSRLWLSWQEEPARWRIDDGAGGSG